MVVVSFPLVNVRDVDLDDRAGKHVQGVEERDGREGPGGRIDAAPGSSGVSP